MVAGTNYMPAKDKALPREGAIGSCVGTIVLLGALCPCCIPSPNLIH